VTRLKTKPRTLAAHVCHPLTAPPTTSDLLALAWLSEQAGFWRASIGDASMAATLFEDASSLRAAAVNVCN
jgi:hypothetical protein